MGLRYHSQTVHQGRNTGNPCPTCGKKFRAQQLLRQHVKRGNCGSKLANTFITACCARFPNKKAMQRHQKTCSLCKNKEKIGSFCLPYTILSLENKYLSPVVEQKLFSYKSAVLSFLFCLNMSTVCNFSYFLESVYSTFE